MPRDWRLRVADILDSIDRTDKYVAGMEYAEFAADTRTQDAVLHNLYIVGEAATHLPDEFTSLHPQIPWPEIQKFRNFLAHGYFNMEVETIWKTVIEDLPPLKAVLFDFESE